MGVKVKGALNSRWKLLKGHSIFEYIDDANSRKLKNNLIAIECLGIWK